MKKCLLLLLIILTFNQAHAQFGDIVGTLGCEAIHQDSSIIKSWATQCNVQRGFKNIFDTTLGFANYGLDSAAVGKADGMDVVSLGDGGIATLLFSLPITNEQGADFVVFENAFIDSFLELAFVEVSSDGQHFVRFSATSNMDNKTQIGAFDNISDASKINNLAGKYRKQYGTPFDLDELKDSANLHVQSITHVRIIDVVGSIDSTICTKDIHGNIINDPFPTPFPSGGFDLDAIGVIHQQPTNIVQLIKNDEVLIFPNPVVSGSMLQIKSAQPIQEILIYSMLGNEILKTNETSISTNEFAKGVYFVKIKYASKTILQKISIE
jgi:hypothetical protein